MDRFTAIVLAAGSGKRMGQELPKQYMDLGGMPLMAHSLLAFQESPVDDIVLVVTPGDQEKCRRSIIEKYGISKCRHIVEGGAERYNSVYAGLSAVSEGYVLIHDCARAFLNQEIIARCMSSVVITGACVAGMPSKDTIKLTDQEGYVEDTPDRSRLWIVQTPQCFEYELIKKAYDIIMPTADKTITDDAMIVEKATRHKVQMIEGSYNNIKVTTPEDIAFGQAILAGKH